MTRPLSKRGLVTRLKLCCMLCSREWPGCNLISWMWFLGWCTRSHSQCGDQQLHWKLDSECWPHCTTVRITLQLCFWILQNVVQISFFMSLWSWVLLLLCNVEYLSQKKTGMATKSTHSGEWPGCNLICCAVESYIPQTEQHEPEGQTEQHEAKGQMLFCLGNVVRCYP